MGACRDLGIDEGLEAELELRVFKSFVFNSFKFNTLLDKLKMDAFCMEKASMDERKLPVQPSLELTLELPNH